jgi:hypothetical protein
MNNEANDFRLQKAYFDRLCEEVLLRSNLPSDDGGIGTLGEKRMHALIKRFLCPNEAFHESPMEGTRYVADIRVGKDVTEVQTGAFYPMRKKIAYYLEKTDCRVTVVHPIPAVKWISWIDPVTYDVSPPKRSPKKGTVLDLLPELYALLPSLGSDRLAFRVLLLEVQDFRWKNGYSRDKKRGSERYERLPVALLGDVSLKTPQDVAALLPDVLREAPFTVKQFSAATRLLGRDAYSAVHALEALGVLTRTTSDGRAMTFSLCVHAT